MTAGTYTAIMAASDDAAPLSPGAATIVGVIVITIIVVILGLSILEAFRR